MNKTPYTSIGKQLIVKFLFQNKFVKLKMPYLKGTDFSITKNGEVFKYSSPLLIGIIQPGYSRNPAEHSRFYINFDKTL